MEFLKNHLFTSFLIACLYFILKSALNRMNTIDSEKKYVRKSLFKDSVLLFVLVYLVLIFKDQLFFLESTKTQVFTNEPTF